MKRLLLVLCVVFAASQVFAQAPYACVTKGAVLEYAYYDEADKIDHYDRQVFQDVTSLGDGNYDFRILHSSIDKPGQKGEGDGAFITMGEIRDNAAKISISLGEAEGTIDVTGSSPNLTTIPNKLAVGYLLPIGDVKVNMEGMVMVASITENEVIGREEIKVPAGNFKCYIVKQTVAMNMMGASVSVTSKTWYSRGVGAVKSESMMGSRLVGRSELVTFNK